MGLVSFLKSKKSHGCSASPRRRPFSDNELPSFILTKAPIHSRLSQEMTPSRFKTCDEPLFLCVLSNNTLHDMLRDFARSERSVENIKIWDNIQNYRAAKNFEERQQIA